jgi:hypothetical protein
MDADGALHEARRWTMLAARYSENGPAQAPVEALDSAAGKIDLLRER